MFARSVYYWDVRKRTVLSMLVMLTGCYREWDWPQAPVKHISNNCVRVINGRYIYNDSCETPRSDSQAILPP